ncbi:hypothetical protein J6590_030386 [Homalodisca vitripennis]|nr:hypothetical protein J6590_030386 [Homalodisca vitripennis]
MDTYQYKRARLRQIFGIRRSTLLLSVFLVGYVVYLVTGGVVFATLEGPGERLVRAKLDLTVATFRARYPSVAEYFRVKGEENLTAFSLSHHFTAPYSPNLDPDFPQF